MNPAISTLSDQWKKIMTDFEPALAWEDYADVEVQTLDDLLARYGNPVFCKIDVEGFELEVLSGLSVPLPALSFELFPTTPERTIACIKKIEKLGNYEYNWSLTESFRMNSPSWLNASAMIHTIKAYTGRKSGDIYARLQSDNQQAMTVHFLITGDIHSLTGGYLYNMHMINGLKQKGYTVNVFGTDWQWKDMTDLEKICRHHLKNLPWDPVLLLTVLFWPPCTK